MKLGNLPWQRDKAWADRYEPVVKKILKANVGEMVAIDAAIDFEDQKQATDMVVRVPAGAVALRIRKDTTKRDLTLRSRRTSGAKTEYRKIVKDGFARWYLYAWTDGDRIVDWMLLDLDKFRACRVGVAKIPFTELCGEIANRDRETAFYFWPRKYLRDWGMVVAEHSNAVNQSIQF